MQPTFNPWLGYFDLINKVDKFIFLDTVQLNQQSWQTRNKLKVGNKEYLVSIPIEKSSSKFDLLIKDVNINKNFPLLRKKLLKTIVQEYKKAEYFDEVYPFLEDLLNNETRSLCDFNINIIKQICKKIGINTPFIKASSLEFIEDKKAMLVLGLCKQVRAAVYYSPLAAKEYLSSEENKFKEENISVMYQHYLHPEYKQLGKDFIPYIGIFDLLLNYGFKNSLEIILKGTNYENS